MGPPKAHNTNTVSTQAYSLEALARKRASGAAPSSGGSPKGLAICARR